MLLASPGFAAVVVLTMALSIGATTTLFSLSYGVLMRPMPWPDADRVVRVFETRGGRAPRVPLTVSNGTYLAWAERPTTIEEIGGWFRNTPTTITLDGQAERVPVAGITPSLLRVLRARPELGRLFVDSDAVPGQSGNALISWGVWQRRLGGRTDAIGTRIRLNERDYTIVGVMPRGLHVSERRDRGVDALVYRSCERAGRRHDSHDDLLGHGAAQARREPRPGRRARLRRGGARPPIPGRRRSRCSEAMARWTSPCGRRVT